MNSIAFNLCQLKSFITVVDTGSFSKAAQHLNQTQPAISQQVQSLENILGCKLLDRSKRPVKLTLTGRGLYLHGSKLLIESYKLQDWMYSIENGKHQLLRIGMVDSFIQVMGIELLKYLGPKVDQIIQISGTAPELLTNLTSGKVDIIITMTNLDIPQELDLYPLFSEQYVLVTPADWPPQEIDALVKNRPYIAFDNTTPTGTQTNSWLRWRSYKLHSQYNIDRADNVLGLVAEGLGWALSSSLFLADQLELLDKLQCQPLPEPRITRQLAVLCRNGDLSDMIDQFVEDVSDIIRQNYKLQAVQKRWGWIG